MKIITKYKYTHTHTYIHKGNKSVIHKIVKRDGVVILGTKMLGREDGKDISNI